MELPKRARFHGLRHTFATDYLDDGGDIWVLREILGHEHISTTERYVHGRDKHVIGKTDHMKNRFLHVVKLAVA